MPLYEHLMQRSVYAVEMPEVAHWAIQIRAWGNTPHLKPLNRASDSTNEYVTESMRLRETGTVFHIKSGRSHFHLCHTFIIPCQEVFFFSSLSLSHSLTLSKQHLWHLLDFMYITLSQLSGENHRIIVGREMSDFVMSSVWFIIRCSSAKCTKGVSLF